MYYRNMIIMYTLSPYLMYSVIKIFSMLPLIASLLVFSPVLINSQAISSFTVNILYDKTSHDSTSSLQNLQYLFCSEFPCEKCPDLTCEHVPGFVLVNSQASQYRVPLDLVQYVLPWFMQFRTSRVRGSGPDLDIAIHPDTELGAEYDYQLYRVWGGRDHPVNTINIYQDNEVKNIETGITKQEEDDWAYTCSSDATGEVGCMCYGWDMTMINVSGSLG